MGETYEFFSRRIRLLANAASLSLSSVANISFTLYILFVFSPIHSEMQKIEKDLSSKGLLLDHCNSNNKYFKVSPKLS